MYNEFEIARNGSKPDVLIKAKNTPMEVFKSNYASAQESQTNK